MRTEKEIEDLARVLFSAWAEVNRVSHIWEKTPGVHDIFYTEARAAFEYFDAETPAPAASLPTRGEVLEIVCGVLHGAEEISTAWNPTDAIMARLTGGQP